MTPRALLFLSSELLLLLQSFPLNWKILIFLPKFPLTLIPLFIAQLMTILELIWMVFVIIWEIFHGKLPLNLVLLLLHVSGSRLKLMYISLTVTLNMMLHDVTSPWFPALCVAVIAYRNHFFRLYRQNKFSASTVKFRPASNCCKRILEAIKADCLVKIFLRTLILITHVSLYLLSLLEIIWNCMLFL